MSSKGRAPFEWINKDASNIASKDHKTKANSHAQSVTWSARKKTPSLKKSSPSTRQTRLPLQHTSSRHRDGLSGYKSELSVQSRDNRRVIASSRQDLSICLSDPASDSFHLLSTQLDPFMLLAGNTTRHERSLIHYYLTVIPITVYGTPNTSVYCPVRDRTAIFVQNNNVWLQWVLLSAEVFLLGNTEAMKSVSVLSRRASLYQTIRKAVSNSATQYSDTTIAHITLAAATEDRIGLRSEAQKHLAAAKRLIIDRGNGGQRVSITTIVAFLWLGVGPEAFPDSNLLEAASASFTSAMFAFYTVGWGQAITTMQDSSEGLLYTYIQSRRRAFHLQSPLRPFIEAVFQDQSASQIRCHMAILWIMNRILWDLRYDYENSIKFLDRIYTLVASADLANLKAIAVLFMIVDCLAQVGKYSNGQTHNMTDIIAGHGGCDSRIMWLWETVDAVELQLLLSKQTRERILQALSAELIEAEIIGEVITESVLNDIVNEIRLGWSYKNLDPSGENNASFA